MVSSGMRLDEYLALKYGPGVSALTRVEASAFRVPFPLRRGWRVKYAGRTLDAAGVEVLAAKMQRKAGREPDGTMGSLRANSTRAVVVLSEVAGRQASKRPAPGGIGRFRRISRSDPAAEFARKVREL